MLTLIARMPSMKSVIGDMCFMGGTLQKIRAKFADKMRQNIALAMLLSYAVHMLPEQSELGHSLIAKPHIRSKIGYANTIL